MNGQQIETMINQTIVTLEKGQINIRKLSKDDSVSKENQSRLMDMEGQLLDIIILLRHYNP